jgi:hypothetical protein
MGFKAQDGIEFLCRIAHVHPLVRLEPPGNPEETVKPHSMINAQDASMSKVMPQASDVIAIALLSKPFRVKGRKAPVLPSAKNHIWWRTS